MITRQEALTFLKEHVKSQSLINHCLAVEAAMRYYAKKFNEDEEKWGITGLIHDWDYEMHGADHPMKGIPILKESVSDPDIIHAIESHGNHTGVARESLLDRTLFAVDELCGFVVAAALVRPTRFEGLQAKSIKKKLKDKRFAAAIKREDVEMGVTELGIDREEHFTNVIEAISHIDKDVNF